jgi:RHS repeat-associated protein
MDSNKMNSCNSKEKKFHIHLYLKAILLALLFSATNSAFSKEVTFEFASNHGKLLFGHEINEYSQYVEKIDDLQLTVTPKSTSTPHLQQCHQFDRPHNIYAHQSFSGLGVKYRPTSFWRPQFLDSGYLDTYGGYTDRLSFSFNHAVTKEAVSVKVKSVRFKRFEPILFKDNAYIRNLNTDEVINVNKENINQSLFLELFPTSFLEKHTFGNWRFDANIETDNFVITPGKYDAFKIYSITVDIQETIDEAPEITSIPNQEVKEGNDYLYQVSTAIQGAEYIYALTEAPNDMTINSATGLVTWSPSFESSGVHQINITVTDSQNREDQQAYNLVVTNDNRPPAITSAAISIANEGMSYQYSVTAIDPDSDALTYELSLSPAGMEIDSEGVISWLPSFKQAGQYDVLVSVSDNDVTVGQNYVLTVSNTNQLPVITSIASISIVENELYDYQILASDLDGDYLSYALATPIVGMTISPEGLINWVPSFEQSGQYPITITVSDGSSTILQDFILTVSNRNRAPVITSQAITDAKENSEYSYSVQSTDPDADTLNYTLVNAPAGVLISNDGTINWTPSYDQSGVHSITVKVSDAQSYVEQAFNLLVSNTNRGPVISSSPIISASENNSYSYSVIAIDEDDNELNYRLITSPTGMSITTAGNLEWIPTFEQAGSHTVTVQVSDDSIEAIQTFNIEVVNVNRQPEILSTAQTLATENTLYQYQLEAVDADGDTINFSLDTAPAGMMITQSGLIEWLPDYQQAGEYLVSINVSDNSETVNQTYTVVVSNENRAPNIVSQAIVSATENNAYVYNVLAEDADADSLSYELIQAPIGMTVAPTGIVTWIPTFNQAGTHEVILNVSDGELVVSQSYVVMVENTNRLPVIASEANTSAQENATYLYSIIANDPDEDVLTFSLITAPEGMTLSAAGIINWLPTFDQAGAHSVVVQVSDLTSSILQSFVIQVESTNRPPLITPINDVVINEASEFSGQVIASDPDANQLEFNLNSAPNGMTISSLGLISWTPSYDQSGTYNIIVEVSDTQLTATSVFSINVNNTNQIPVINSTPIITATENRLYQYQVQSTDADLNTLNYQLTEFPLGMSINSSGLITWTPDYMQSGSHLVSVSISDGLDAAVQSFTLNVENINRSPTFISAPVTEIKEKETYEYLAQANDPDGDDLQYAIILAPTGMLIDPLNGNLVWNTTKEDIGAHYIVISAIDSGLSQVEQGFTLTVTNVNDAPVINSIAPVSGTENQAYSYQIEATDEDADVLSYSLLSKPDGMAINSETGLISWLPTFQQSGQYQVNVQVNDGQGLIADQIFTITINNSNQIPQINSTPELNVEIGVEYEYQVKAIDADGDALTYQLTNAPLGMSISETTGLLKWTAVASNVGDNLVEVSVSDSTDQTIQIFALNVTKPEAPIPLTHMGTEFWFTFNPSYKSTEYPEKEQLTVTVWSHYDTQVRLSSKIFDEDIVVDLAENKLHTFDLTEFKSLFDRTESGISNDALVLTSSRPIAALINNEKYASQDSALLFPLHALGSNYFVLSYTESYHKTFGPGFKAVAPYDNTTVTMSFTQDVIWNEEVYLRNTPFTVVLDSGQTIQVDTTGIEVGQDIMGSEIQSDKLLSVFSGSVCTDILDQACDHLVEQLMPVESLSSEYISVPLATRKKGDTLRAMATQNDTVITFNDSDFHVLDKSEFIEELIEGPAIFESNNPIYVAQYSNGAFFDKDERETAITMADPFMLTVPAVQTYLKKYLIATPSENVSLNFVNLISIKGTEVFHNDQSLSLRNWVGIENSEYQYLQLQIESGMHNFESTDNFGAYQYGYDYYVSYGNQSGMHFRDQRVAHSLKVTFDNINQDTGKEVCVKASVYDEEGIGISVVPVTFSNQLYTLANRTLLTNDKGEITYCYTSLVSGTQSLEIITEEGLSETTNIDWNSSLVITDTKPRFVNYPGEHGIDPTVNYAFEFDFDAVDLDGGEVTFSLLRDDVNYRTATDMVLDDSTGQLTWDVPQCFEFYSVKVQATDDEGQSNVMNFSIHRPEGTDRIPKMVNEPANDSSPVGIHYEFPIQATCFDVYQVPISLISGPEGLGINFVYKKGYVRWRPQLGQEGTHEVVYEVNDGKGGALTKSFEITVTPNQSPVINSIPVTEVFANETYKYTLYNTDADGHSLTTTMLEGPKGSQFDGRIFTWVPGLNQIGSHTISFEVDDGYEGKDAQTFELNVLENQAPLVNVIPDSVVKYGETFGFVLPNIQDPDGHDINYELLTYPEGMEFGTSNIWMRWTPSENQIGIHRVVLEVTDTLGAVSLLPFYITVLKNNDPTIFSEDRYYVAKGTEFRTLILSLDIDGQNTVMSLVSGPDGVTGSNPSHRELQLSWRPATDQLGEYTVRVKAHDSIGGISYKDIIFEVVDSTFVFDANQSSFMLMVNSGLSQLISTQGAPVTMGLLQGPTGLTFSNKNKKMYWTPDSTQIGSHSVLIQAEDNLGNIKVLEVTLQVVSENLAPQISPIGNQAAQYDLLWQADIAATDLEGEAITLTVESGPKNLYLDPLSHQLNWIPTQVQVGNHTVVISATDESSHSSQTQFEINVQPKENKPPEFISVPTDKAVLVAPYVYEIEILDKDSDATAVQIIRGPRGMQLEGNEISWQAEVSQLGAHEVQLKVTDGISETYQIFTINVVDENTAPIVNFSSPIDNIEITQPTAIFGRVDDVNIKQWTLMIKEASAATDKWRELYSGTDKAEGELGILDTTLMTNGQYDLMLMATDSRDLVSQTFASVLVNGDLKVGHFSFTVTDLEIPLAGIPIRISRTYDSRRIHEDLDFGLGWSLSMTDVKLEESRIPGDGWELRQYSAGPLNTLIEYCVEPLLPAPIITVSLPNGDVEEFNLQASPQCNMVEPIRDVEITFVAKSGTDSILEATDINRGRLVNDIIVGDDFVDALNPNEYKLTTKQGYIYYINQASGVVKIEDPNGYFVTFSDDEIAHSSGKSIKLQRYDSGRIHSIIDPNGNENKYGYSSSGGRYWLNWHNDPLGNTTQYKYLSNTNLYLTEIIDPLGRPLIKNIYDENGRLTGQEDGEGNLKTFDHNIDARTSIVTDLDGRSTLFNYSDKGNVTQEIKVISDNSYDGDIVTSFDYDENDNQTTKTIGSEPYTWISSFDDSSNQLSAIDPEGNTVEYKNYNARGQEGTIVDELGRETVMVYDYVGNLEKIEMPALIDTDTDTGAEQQLSASNIINNKGQVTQSTDLRGMVTSYTYYSAGHESAGQKLTQGNNVNGITTYTYDANNNVKTEARQRTVNAVLQTETFTYEYDKRDRLIKTLYPDTSYIQTDYDLAGNVEKERDRFGAWTDYQYDAYGRLKLTTYTDGTIEQRQYSAEGLLKSVTDVSGLTTSYEYDDAGRLWKTIFHDSTFTETRYTPQGWVKSETDAQGNLTEYEYDLSGKRILVVRFEGENLEEIRHSFTYYKNGELKSETDANGHTTHYEINVLDKRILTTYHNNTSVGQRYDALGARTEQVDQNDRATKYGYDNLGRLLNVQAQVQINQLDVSATSYTYDEVGNKLTQTDAEGRTTSWIYDYRGRMLSRMIPEGMIESYVYDDENRITTHTDFNGKITITISDAMGRTQRISYSDGTTETYTYWPSGQIKSTTVRKQNQDDRVTSYTYDNRQQLSTETQSDGTVLSYQYDASGNRTQIITTRETQSGEGTVIVNYSYDTLSRLKTVTDQSGVTTYTYDKVGNQKTVTYANGIVTEYTYNSVNQLINLITKNSNDEVMNSYSYQLDNTGRRQSIAEKNGRYTDYDYDELYRLTDEIIKANIDATQIDYSANYQYDWVGNRTYEAVDGVQTVYSYDLNDRLTSQGGSTYSYDNNGNTLTETVDNRVKNYTYDYKNKLIGFTTTESGVEVSSSTYSYNSEGIRDSKTEGGITTFYVVDSNRDFAQVLEEIVGGESKASYSYGHDLLSLNREADFKFYQYDGLGSTRALSNSAGDVTDTYDYEAFGEVINETGTTQNNYKFTGEQFDKSLDLYYFRARYYDQGVGRFTQQDLYGGKAVEPITLHRYIYANVNPVSYVDPTGYFASLSGAMSSLNIMSSLSAGASSTLARGLLGFSGTVLRGGVLAGSVYSAEVGFKLRERAVQILSYGDMYGGWDEAIKLYRLSGEIIKAFTGVPLSVHQSLSDADKVFGTVGKITKSVGDLVRIIIKGRNKTASLHDVIRLEIKFSASVEDWAQAVVDQEPLRVIKTKVLILRGSMDDLFDELTNL